MRVSFVQRRYLVPRTPTVRPMDTTTVTLRRRDMDLHASDLTIRDGFNRSDAHLSILSHSQPEPDGFRRPSIVAQTAAKLNIRRCYLRQKAEAQVSLARSVFTPTSVKSCAT